MQDRLRQLINTPDIELWPAAILHVRGNAQARLVAKARWVLRRKRDGRYLAAVTSTGIRALSPRWMHEPGIQAALRALDAGPRECGGLLPLTRLTSCLARLGINASAYAARTGLSPQAEPRTLDLAGFDRYRRPLWLLANAGRAWQRMRAAALLDGVGLDAISGYRSHAYQLGIVQRKLQRGLALEQILAVNAAPGFSEHHTGRALDIGTEGEPPAEPSFEHTPAFAWLSRHAARFGFHLSYPRDNPHGLLYEPWHWYYRPTFL